MSRMQVEALRARAEEPRVSARDRGLLREAASTIERMMREVGETADRNIAARKQAEAEAARRGYEVGRQDGYGAGLDVALCPIEPAHAATVLAWRERRAASDSGESLRAERKDEIDALLKGMRPA